MRRRRVLIVDDDRPVCEAFKKLLETERFEVLTALNKAVALDYFCGRAFDLVILDINLGEDDGWDVLRAIRQIDPAVPVVMITAESGQFDYGRTAAADALVEKPIDVPSFLAVLNELSRNKSSENLQESNRCQYVPRNYVTFLKLMQERRSQPIVLSPEMYAALPAWQCPDEVPVNRPSVIGDPTTIMP